MHDSQLPKERLHGTLVASTESGVVLTFSQLFYATEIETKILGVNMRDLYNYRRFILSFLLFQDRLCESFQSFIEFWLLVESHFL